MWLAMLSDEKTVEPLQEALDAYALAGEITTLERGDLAKWQQLQTSISTTLLMQGIMSFDKAKVEEAKAVAIRGPRYAREAGLADRFLRSLSRRRWMRCWGCSPQ